MRLLVLDSSGLLGWVVRHAVPEGVEVEMVASLEAAEQTLTARAPDAAVVNLPLAHLPWRSFQHRCALSRPPVPVLYESCVHASAAEADLDPADGYAAFLPTPAAPEQLRSALVRLLAEARRLARVPAPEDSGSRPAPDPTSAPGSRATPTRR